MTGSTRRAAAAGLGAVLVAGLLTAASTGALAAPVVYEAENGTITNGAVSTQHPGFTGTGFVDTANAVGAAVAVTVTAAAAGDETLVFRYANGTTANRTATLFVNDTARGTLTFPPTGGWPGWQTQAATAPLAAGANTVRVTATTAGGLPNVDSVTAGTAPVPPGEVLPGLRPNLVTFYDFEHPSPTNAAVELNQGSASTGINLVNGGAAMRVADGAYPGSTNSLQLRQVRPTVRSNDDWKAGVYSGSGVPTLSGFRRIQGLTIMGWFKMTGQNPSPNSNTAGTGDLFGAVGFAGVLSGNSNGHQARGLIELFEVDGRIRLSVLGRRIDNQPWQVFAATEDWRTLLPQNTWVHLAATLNYTTGVMLLFRNGLPVPGFYGVDDDPWGIGGGGGPFFTSDTNPRGIKIGGSFPQNNQETNPCNCRMDGLMFLNRDATPAEVQQQYALSSGQRSS